MQALQRLGRVRVGRQPHCAALLAKERLEVWQGHLKGLHGSQAPSEVFGSLLKGVSLVLKEGVQAAEE